MNLTNMEEIKATVKAALKEDIGRGDITTQTFISASKNAKAVLLAKENCVLCGLSVVSLVFKTVDSRIKFKPLVKEGSRVEKGQVLARISGKAKSILSAERVALNFISFLSGIATKTRKFAEKVKPYPVKIMDTRKTIPGLRSLEKYAVRVGGGFNHRFSLDQMIMIKDNHLKVTGGYKGMLLEKEPLKIETEVANLQEFKEALKLKPDYIMLDNMNIRNIRRAVEIKNSSKVNSRIRLEASGGISLKNIKQVASCGIDMISVGELTHSIDSVDISLEIYPAFAVLPRP